MRVPSKTICVVGIVATVALTASAEARQRHVDTSRFGGAYNSVSVPAGAPNSSPGNVVYGAGSNPYPTGHGSTGNSMDFQLVR